MAFPFSTFANLIIRDREYDIEDYRKHIAVTFQDFSKYDLSVKENIGLGDLSRLEDLEAIREAARKADADNLISQLPRQYDEILGRMFGGVDLSGGEWQKIAIARAFVRDAAIQILDEPSAALDAQSEVQVFNSFSEISRGKITIMISHRFSTVKMADKIIVLDNGTILENGTHEELMLYEGKYHELYTAQAERYK